MDPKTIESAIAIGVQLAQAALDWQTKLASPGGITEADIDAKLLEVGQSRQDLAAAIAERRAKDAAASAPNA